MATPKSQPEPSNEPRTIKMCFCGATVFEGPFDVGEISGDGKMVVRYSMFKCVNCNRTQTVDQMIDHTVPIPAM